jgi:hypothetical protein
MFKKQFGNHKVAILYVGFFFVNDDKDVNENCLQTMRCTTITPTMQRINNTINNVMD